MQTGVIPMFVPFAHLFAAVLTATLTGSMYYVISSPKGNVVECNQSLLSKWCRIIYMDSRYPEWLSLKVVGQMVGPIWIDLTHAQSSCSQEKIIWRIVCTWKSFIKH
jgi:hypothetical protein